MLVKAILSAALMLGAPASAQAEAEKSWAIEARQDRVGERFCEATIKNDNGEQLAIVLHPKAKYIRMAVEDIAYSVPMNPGGNSFKLTLLADPGGHSMEVDGRGYANHDGDVFKSKLSVSSYFRGPQQMAGFLKRLGRSSSLKIDWQNQEEIGRASEGSARFFLHEVNAMRSALVKCVMQDDAK